MLGENDDGLNRLAVQVNLSIQYLESMISNKEFVNKKKINKRKTETIDILARNPIQSFYRDAFLISLYGYKLMSDSLDAYVSFFKKKKT